jgi:hypothetical protein
MLIRIDSIPNPALLRPIAPFRPGPNFANRSSIRTCVTAQSRRRHSAGTAPVTAQARLQSRFPCRILPQRRLGGPSNARHTRHSASHSPFNPAARAWYPPPRCAHTAGALPRPPRATWEEEKQRGGTGRCRTGGSSLMGSSVLSRVPVGLDGGACALFNATTADSRARLPRRRTIDDGRS